MPLDWIAHPIEGREKGRLANLYQAIPHRKDIYTAQISKAFEVRLTPNRCLSPPLSPECLVSHYGMEFHFILDQQLRFVLPLFQLIRVSYPSAFLSSLAAGLQRVGARPATDALYVIACRRAASQHTAATDARQGLLIRQARLAACRRVTLGADARRQATTLRGADKL
ncbi:hypothetical protein BHE74_00000229 [Ensete ventricosum]|nr:hypothetical protein BHE74_00000229 [Ensete ventricosum]